MLNTENNKRIAKNTILLYFRMLITMGVSLYTSRIVLNTLGIEDFGIYNVVGGFIIMFGFLNNAMAASTQRFLSFELGKNDFPQLVKVFSMSVGIHFIIALIIFVIAETGGLWFVNTQLTIPDERLEAAKWVYQFSILSFLVGVLSVPYNAGIIAHERMNVFAWVSIIEVSLNLIIVLILQWMGFDKLKLFAFLTFVVALLIRLIYGIYCTRNFAETKYKFFWDISLFKEMINFAGWNLWGSAAVVFYSQGVNILLNIFFGPIVNAAYGIASRLQVALNSFVLNFQMAMNPQIFKSYASKDLHYMHQLIYNGAKYSFFLLFTLALPILIETKIILEIWLKIVPEHTVIFTRLILINIIISNLSGSLGIAAQASGNIKLYQGVIGGLLILILPITYLLYKVGFQSIVTFYVSIIISFISLFIRLIIVKKLIQIKIREYLLKVVLKAITVSLFAVILPYIIYLIFEENILRLILVSSTAIFSTIFSIYLFGINKFEKDYLLNMLVVGKKRLFSKTYNNE